MKLTLIGAGNVATHLGIALKASGHQIMQVFSRSHKPAKELAEQIDSKFITGFNNLNKESLLYIIAVKDEAIATVISQINVAGGFIVHTSGSTDIELLSKASKNYGVFYPLQTLSKNIPVNFRSVPVCIEANNIENEKILLDLAKSVSDNVYSINSEQRKILHLAAVFAGNFSNYMYAIAEDILKKNQLSLDLLKPLIIETACKIARKNPREMQTGPAIRGDVNVINQHIHDLENEPAYQKIYEILTNGIRAIKK